MIESDGDLLHRSILLHPEDDAPRLVYADWLDEHGGDVECDECVDGDVGCPTCHGAGIYYDPPYSLNRLKCPKCNDGLLPDKCKKCGGTGRVSNGNAARAEFIRVQCELARFPPCPNCTCRPHVPHSDNCPHHVWVMKENALRRRERELGFESLRTWFDLPAEGHVACLTDVRFVGDDRTYFVRRGFVESVALTTAAFVGRPCETCDVSPGVRRYTTTGGDWIEGTCNVCYGTGRNPQGLAAALFKEHPITAVRLTDREPLELFPGRWSWGQQTATRDHEQRDRLPVDLFMALFDGPSRLTGQEAPYPERDDRYHTADAAHAALIAAAVAYGRREAEIDESECALIGRLDG